MAKASTKEAPTASREILSGDRPSHLMKTGGGTGGPGRSRIPTEFDDQILGWYESKEWKGIPSTGETDEDRKKDFEENFKAVKRAADHHDLGLERARDEENLIVWVNVRDKATRGPVPGSLKDPETGKMEKPGTARHAELVEMKQNGTMPVAASTTNGSTDNEDLQF